MKKAANTYENRTRTKRKRRPYPLNIRKNLGPKSPWRGCLKKRRGQG